MLAKYDSQKLSNHAEACIRHIREKASEMDEFINEFVPNSRERDLAITKLEEAAMWCNKALAMHQEDVK